MYYQTANSVSGEYFRRDFSVDYSCPVHLHQSYEINVCISGRIELTVDSKNYILDQGEAVFIFPHQLHSMKGEGSRHMVCIFSPELVKAYSRKTALQIPDNSKFIPSVFLIDALKNLSGEGSVISKKWVLYCLCDEFDKGASYSPKPSEDKNLLFRIFNFVEKNFSHSCSLEMLAKETSFSYSYLSRYFKNTAGMSFNSYVNKCRINNACYLLRNTDCNVLQCSVDCGYNSLRSFNRNFKEIMGVTPLEYREAF